MSGNREREQPGGWTMTKEELHDAVDIEMIEPESVRITENWEEA